MLVQKTPVSVVSCTYHNKSAVNIPARIKSIEPVESMLSREALRRSPELTHFDFKACLFIKERMLRIDEEG